MKGYTTAGVFLCVAFLYLNEEKLFSDRTKSAASGMKEREEEHLW